MRRMAKTLLAIGAHYDDCVFGVPGILLQAARKHYRVVVLSLIGDSSNWAPTKGREKECAAGTVAISKDHGAEICVSRPRAPGPIFAGLVVAMVRWCLVILTSSSARLIDINNPGPSSRALTTVPEFTAPCAKARSGLS